LEERHQRNSTSKNHENIEEQEGMNPNNRLSKSGGSYDNIVGMKASNVTKILALSNEMVQLRKIIKVL